MVNLPGSGAQIHWHSLAGSELVMEQGEEYEGWMRFIKRLQIVSIGERLLKPDSEGVTKNTKLDIDKHTAFDPEQK